MSYYTYILQSLTTGKFYFGQTQNLKTRLEKHNKGHVPSTKHGIPWKLRFAVKFASRSEAMRLEKQFKNLKSHVKVEAWMLRNAHLDCSAGPEFV